MELPIALLYVFVALLVAAVFVGPVGMLSVWYRRRRAKALHNMLLHLSATLLGTDEHMQCLLRPPLADEELALKRISPQLALTSAVQYHINEHGPLAWQFASADATTIVRDGTTILFSDKVRCCQTDIPIPSSLHNKSVFYFELAVLAKPRSSMLSIGLAPHNYPAVILGPGLLRFSVGLRSDGAVFAHGKASATCDPADNVQRAYNANDTVGCGFNVLKRSVFFTVNGKVVLQEAVSNLPDYAYHPTVGATRGVLLNANFGQSPFVFSHANEHNLGFMTDSLPTYPQPCADRSSTATSLSRISSASRPPSFTSLVSSTLSRTCTLRPPSAVAPYAPPMQSSSSSPSLSHSRLFFPRGTNLRSVRWSIGDAVTTTPAEMRTAASTLPSLLAAVPLSPPPVFDATEPDALPASNIPTTSPTLCSPPGSPLPCILNTEQGDYVTTYHHREQQQPSPPPSPLVAPPAESRSRTPSPRPVQQQQLAA
ncbi:hypothetical protein RI367_003040 [Sorochytrium milnesiophthora]